MKTSPRLFALCAFVVSLFGVAPAMAQQADRSLAGDKVCTKCHNEAWPSPVLSIYQTRHGNKADSRTPGCQDCHGRSDAHLKSPVNVVDVYFGAVKPGPLQSTTWPKTPSTAEARNGACLACHESRVLARTNWTGSQHESQGVACTNCHNIHAPDQRVLSKATQAEVCFTCHKDQRTDSRKISHHPIGEGKVVCSNCHNPHGSPGPKLLKKNTVNETCFTCHAEKRGPFLWEHQPVTEDCTNCHSPHGSNISPLLKSRTPFLCQECHDGPHHSKDPYAASVAGTQGGKTAVPSENDTGRACLNCHSMVHGSNHPAGALLHR